MTETLESKPVEPAKVAELEPGIEYVVELEENQDKQLCIYSLHLFNLI